MEACSLLVNLRKGMQSSSEQPLVGEEHCVTTLITAAKETSRDIPEWTLPRILISFLDHPSRRFRFDNATPQAVLYSGISCTDQSL